MNESLPANAGVDVFGASKKGDKDAAAVSET